MASGWNPEAAYTSPGKPGLLWVCPSAGALGILYNVLPFCGEEQAHGAQLGLLGSQRGFKHGGLWAALGPTQWCAGLLFLGYLFFLHMGCTAGTPLPSETWPKAGKNTAGPWRASFCVLTFEIIKKLVLIKKFQNKASDFPSPKV